MINVDFAIASRSGFLGRAPTAKNVHLILITNSKVKTSNPPTV